MIAQWNRYEINSSNLFKNLNSDQFWQPILYKLLEEKISEKPSCLYMIEVIKNLRKIKNFQFHLKSCHLDLFFLDNDKTYIFKHFDIRPSTIVSKLDKKKCVEELNNKFTLIRDPK